MIRAPHRATPRSRGCAPRRRKAAIRTRTPNEKVLHHLQTRRGEQPGRVGNSTTNSPEHPRFPESSGLHLGVHAPLSLEFLRFVRFGRVSSANSPKERKECTATDTARVSECAPTSRLGSDFHHRHATTFFIPLRTRPSAAPTLTTHTHHHASPRKKLSRSQGRRPQQQPSSLPGPAKPNTHNSSLSLKIYAIIDCPQKIFVCCLPLASSPTSHSSRPPQLGRFEIAHSSMGGFSPRRPSVVASLYGES